jgi:ATP-binding cassette, subfamily B, bacterial
MLFMKKEVNHTKKTTASESSTPSVFSLLGKYTGLIVLLVALTVIANALSISVPNIISNAIDDYATGNFVVASLILKFSLIAFLIFIFTCLQNIVQIWASERVARDLRSELIAKISVQPYSYIETISPTKLLTNLTSDVDAVKNFVSTAISSIISSVFLIIGVSVLLILTDWRLALIVLSIMPILGVTFFFVLKKVHKLFTKAQEAIDWLNKVISENILGATLIRLLNSKSQEHKKFILASAEAKDVSFAILKIFSSLIPIINFFTNIATLSIVLLGGYFVIQNEMTLGNFTAFNSYLAILIFPILILGFISNLIAQAQASYERIVGILKAPVQKKDGGLEKKLRGDIEAKNVTVEIDGKTILKDISFSINAGSKTAIIGPTAAGKSQLLYLLTGLLSPTSGEIFFDGKKIDAYKKECLHNQVGFVFQDSAIFNLSLRENISFSSVAQNKNLEKAIKTAELNEYISGLPKKLDTVVSERGNSLSGGQKQRIMLARALALNPKVLLLDDFTARVDTNTEQKILQNLANNYPHLTLLSVTQKISAIEHYDQIILLMEGELLANGTHKQLMYSSPEYVQIFRSQQSTSKYELDSKE